MRINESSEKLSIEPTLLEHLLVGTPCKNASVVFNRASRSLRIRHSFLRKLVKEIPFSWIRRVRHHIEAGHYFIVGTGEGLIVRPYPLEAHSSELSIEYVDRTKEIVYFWWDLWPMRSGTYSRAAIQSIQEMADRISAFTGIPGLIVSDELQGTFDIGSGQLTLHGECLAPGFKGLVIPFGEIQALRSIMTSGGYYAVEFRTKNRGDILVNEGYASSTRLHETAKMIAKSAGIPFELQDAVATPSSAGHPYKPIMPTSKGGH